MAGGMTCFGLTEGKQTLRPTVLNSRAADYLWFDTDFFVIISVSVEFKIIISKLFLSTNLEQWKTIEKML